jgi:GT2 family glycosyltransferase
MQQPPRVSVLILQYNNSDKTIKCLESLAVLRYQNFSVTVIDNASAEHEIQAVEEFIGGRVNSSIHFQLIRNQENLGYAGGNNVGITHAVANGTDYVLILNNDTVVKEEFLDTMIETAQEKKLDIVGAATQEDGGIAYHGEINWLRPELRHSTVPILYNKTRDIYIPGSALLVRSDVFKKIGLFDERYFLYFEDADFSMRAHKAGLQLGLLTAPLISHAVSSTTRSLGASALLYYHYRNAHLFNLLHAPGEYKILLPFWSFWVIVKQLLKFVLRPSKRQASTMILQGVFDFYNDDFGRLNA